MVTEPASLPFIALAEQDLLFIAFGAEHLSSIASATAGPGNTRDRRPALLGGGKFFEGRGAGFSCKRLGSGENPRKIVVARAVLHTGSMNVSLYQAAAAMNANARWQDVISQNLSASSIPGARKQEVSFSTVEAGLVPGLNGLNGGRFVIPSSATAVNFQQGALRPTGTPSDVAIEGPGFLEVQLPNGGHAFTRNGELQLNAQGQLVTSQGYTVIGDGGPLQMDPTNGSPLSVSPTGELSQGAEVKGRIRLVEFSQPKLLKAIGNGYFLADNPQSQPLAAVSSQLRQGFLGANMSPTTEMTSLITSMRMFEANQKVLQMQDDRMGRVISDLGNPS